jgi:hypothetical protein
MDNVTMIRALAGVLAVVLLTVIVSRRKKTAATKRVDAKRY